MSQKHHEYWQQLIKKHYPDWDDDQIASHAAHFVNTHPDFNLLNKVFPKKHRRKFTGLRFILWLIVFLLFAIFCATVSHAQIDVIIVTNNGTRVFTAAAPFTLDFGANLTVTRVGNGVSVAASGSGGTWPGYPAGTGIVAVTGGAAWGTTYNASNLIPANFISTLNQNTTGTAANITGTSNSTLTTLSSLALPYAQLTGTPALAANTIAVSHQFFTAYNSTTGAFTQAQPAYTDISGTPTLAATLASVSHKWLNSYTASTGLFTQTQPGCGDLSDASTGCSTTVGTAATHAATDFLSSSTVLPSTLASVSHKWINSYASTTGLFTQTQPVCADLSDSGTACTAASSSFLSSSTVLPANTTGTASNWFSAYNSTTGVFTKSQPACGDLSNAGTACTATAPAGTIVGTTDTQTLTNKSIAGSEINSGTVSATNGGTGANNSAATGVEQWASGTQSVSTALASGTTATTQSANDNSTKVGTTAYVDTHPVNVVVNTSTPVTVSTTLGAQYHFNENATAATAVTYNLPTAAAGKQFCFSNAFNGTAANTGILTIATSASGQFIIFTDGTLSATGGNVTSGGAAVDAACMVGVDATHWMLYVQRGTWSKH